MISQLLSTHRICTLFFSLLLGLSFCLPALAAAQEQITSYQTTAEIQADSTVRITERIAYDFGSELKRGIYRDIDTVKKIGGQTYRLELSDIEVVGGTGEVYEMELLNRSEGVRLNIGGDIPHWTGVTIFEIRYTIAGLLVFNENSDTLLLDVIGFDWGVPILESQAKIVLPESVESRALDFECFSGQSGSTNTCDEVLLDNSTESSSESINQITVKHYGELGNNAGMSIGLTFPKGLVAETPATEIESIPLLFLFLLGLSILPLIYAARHFYKESKVPLTLPIVRQYDGPKNISLFEAGLILKHGYRTSHLAASIIDLAQRGYLKIVHYQKQVLSNKTSEYLYVQLRTGEDLLELDKELFTALFAKGFLISKEKALEALRVDETIPESIVRDITSAVAVTKVSKLKNKFSTSLLRMSTLAKTMAIQNTVFVEDFDTARGNAVSKLFTHILYTIASVIGLFIVLIQLYSERSFDTVGLVFVGVVIVGTFLLLLISFFIYRLPKLSPKGVAIKEHLLGLKEYMEVAEKERMEFHFDPEKNPELFEKLLPYALLLGMEQRWTKHLEKLDYQPNWYHSSSGQPFSAVALRSVVSSMSSSTRTSTRTSRTRVGSAGGGFGGGGGGSR